MPRASHGVKPGAGAASAFTLVELVTVIAILGIVAVGVGGPTLAFMNDIRGRAAAARVTADMRYAQRAAMASGLRTWVVVNSGSNNYRLFIEDRNNLGKAGRLPMIRPVDQSSAAVQFGAGPYLNVGINSVDFNGTSELEFDSFGVPYDGNDNELTAAGSLSFTDGSTVTVHPVGGFVERGG